MSKGRPSVTSSRFNRQSSWRAQIGVKHYWRLWHSCQLQPAKVVINHCTILESGSTCIYRRSDLLNLHVDTKFKMKRARAKNVKHTVAPLFLAICPSVLLTVYLFLFGYPFYLSVSVLCVYACVCVKCGYNHLCMPCRCRKYRVYANIYAVITNEPHICFRCVQIMYVWHALMMFIIMELRAFKSEFARQINQWYKPIHPKLRIGIMTIPVFSGLGYQDMENINLKTLFKSSYSCRPAKWK